MVQGLSLSLLNRGMGSGVIKGLRFCVHEGFRACLGRRIWKRLRVCTFQDQSQTLANTRRPASSMSIPIILPLGSGRDRAKSHNPTLVLNA